MVLVTTSLAVPASGQNSTPATPAAGSVLQPAGAPSASSASAASSAPLRLNIGLDRPVGDGQVQFGLSYSAFGEDQADTTTYSTGDRLIANGAWSFPVKKFSIDALEEVSAQQAARLVCAGAYQGADCYNYRLNPSARRFVHP